jgi:hypothetical protein
MHNSTLPRKTSTLLKNQSRKQSYSATRNSLLMTFCGRFQEVEWETFSRVWTICLYSPGIHTRLLYNTLALSAIGQGFTLTGEPEAFLILRLLLLWCLSHYKAVSATRLHRTSTHTHTHKHTKSFMDKPASISKGINYSTTLTLTVKSTPVWQRFISMVECFLRNKNIYMKRTLG